MNKLDELRIKLYIKKALIKFSYLNIKHLYSPLDKEYKHLYERFHSLDKNCIARFPFHNNGIINKEDFFIQKKNAEQIFITRVNSISETIVYLTLSIYDVSFWVKLETASLKSNLSLFMNDMSCNFFIFTDNGLSLQLYRAEYEWEIFQSDIKTD